jgi:hypothetical protein
LTKVANKSQSPKKVPSKFFGKTVTPSQKKIAMVVDVDVPPESVERPADDGLKAEEEQGGGVGDGFDSKDLIDEDADEGFSEVPTSQVCEPSVADDSKSRSAGEVAPSSPESLSLVSSPQQSDNQDVEGQERPNKRRRAEGHNNVAQEFDGDGDGVVSSPSHQGSTAGQLLLSPTTPDPCVSDSIDVFSSDASPPLSRKRVRAPVKEDDRDAADGDGDGDGERDKAIQMVAAGWRSRYLHSGRVKLLFFLICWV